MNNNIIVTTISVADARGNIARIIDHTLLRADATLDDLEKLCREAREYSFAAVCVNPGNVAYCVEHLAGSGIPVATVVGFPLGANTISTKEIETEFAVDDGALEIDMVLNIGMLKSGNDNYVREDIQAVVEAARSHLVKVIIETALLTETEKIRACELAKLSGANFVKTSTGFSKAGATAEDVALMRRIVGDDLGVKASGGIRSFEEAIKMVEAGANRIGTSSGVQIVRRAEEKLKQ
ncbi:MAG TPA: deoxyribose-phosphate aldolase [Candidatus Marinimicrobia bacterium]|nr:deoxyribose-phosphate aldolase [Candidatus Neomarinimicrobiota bacterium]